MDKIEERTKQALAKFVATWTNREIRAAIAALQYDGDQEDPLYWPVIGPEWYFMFSGGQCCQCCLLSHPVAKTQRPQSREEALRLLDARYESVLRDDHDAMTLVVAWFDEGPKYRVRQQAIQWLKELLAERQESSQLEVAVVTQADRAY